MTDALYANYRRWKLWEANSFGNYKSGNATYYCKELALCGCGDLQEKFVLELGFGNGEFAAWVTNAGARYVGTEINAELLSQARENGFEVFSADRMSEFTASGSQINVAVAFDVFEHIEQDALRELLLKICAMLKPGGLLVARVPSGDSPFARSIQHGDLTHRTVLGSSAVRQLAQDAGLEPLQIREPAFPFAGGGFKGFLRRLTVQSLRRICFPIIARLFMNGGKPVLTPNLLFVLKKPLEN